MDDSVARRDRGYVCAIAVHALMVSRQDPELRAALAGSSLTVPDGRPLVWALNALGESLPDRVYGPELMSRYCARCAERGHPVWLCGGHDSDALAQLERSLQQRYPGIVIAGTESRRTARTPPPRTTSSRPASTPTAPTSCSSASGRQGRKWMARIRPGAIDVPRRMRTFGSGKAAASTPPPRQRPWPSSPWPRPWPPCPSPPDQPNQHTPPKLTGRRHQSPAAATHPSTHSTSIIHTYNMIIRSSPAADQHHSTGAQHPTTNSSIP